MSVRSQKPLKRRRPSSRPTLMVCARLKARLRAPEAWDSFPFNSRGHKTSCWLCVDKRMVAFATIVFES